MKTLLVSVDFSAATRAVVETAVELAQASRARLLLHHSVMPPVVTAEFGVSAELMQETLEVLEKGARRQLAHIEDELTARGVQTETALTTGGPAADRILEKAAECKAAMIVLGSHGHTALYDLLVGGTTHGVLRKAQCPVVVVPPGATSPAKRRR